MLRNISFYFTLKSKLLIILSLCFFVLFLSCTGKQQKMTENSLLDSLDNHCYTLLVKLQTDSLRIAAQEYMDATTKYSKKYFKARQYYINSYFNDRDFKKVLDLLDETERMNHFNDYPVIVCDYLYTRARVFQYTSRYPEAIEVFKRCLTFNSKENEQEQLLHSVLASMTQLLNTYISNGNAAEGYRYFKELKEQPTPVIKRFALRDLYSHLGYLAMISAHEQEAFQLTDSVFLLPLHNPNSEKLFQNYSYAAAVFFNNPDTKKRVIKWLERAMEEADKYDYTGGVQWSIDMLANLYWQLNKVEEGTELQYRALKMAQKRGEKGAECNCYMSLSILYRNWELYSQANNYADQAIAVISPTNDYRFQGFAFRTKARIMQAMNMPDSSIYYYQVSDKLLTKANLPGESNITKASLAKTLIDYYTGEKLAMGVKQLKEVNKNSSRNTNRSYDFYYLGKGLIKQGHIHEGEAMLDSMYAEMLRMKNATYSDGVLEYVLDHYLSQKNAAKVIQYSILYRQQTDVRYNEKISRKVTMAMVQYQTEKKEQQLKLANTELSVKDLKIKLYIIAVLLLVCILTGGTLWYLHKQKLHKNLQLLIEQEKLIAQRECELAEIRLHEQESRLAGALENLREANFQSEQIQEQLNDFLSDRVKQQSIASITPSVLREKGEVKFRRYFNQLHPTFLASLKERIPDITRGEEILSMLIALKQNMEETADILCIEKKSVKMTRYRLRKKIGIEQEESLEEFIINLL